MFSDLAQGLLSFVQGMASELEIIAAQFRVALEQLWITSMHHLAHGVLSFPVLQLALPGFQEADENLLWFRIQREQTRPWTSPSSASLSTTSGTTAVAELALTFPSRSEWCGGSVAAVAADFFCVATGTIGKCSPKFFDNSQIYLG